MSNLKPVPTQDEYFAQLEAQWQAEADKAVANYPLDAKPRINRNLLLVAGFVLVVLACIGAVLLWP